MKSVNATIELFASVKKNDDYLSFSVPFDTIKCIIKNNVPYISDFFIVTNLNLMGTTNKETIQHNIVQSEKTLYCLIRLTKVSKDENLRVSWDIEEFSIDASNRNIRFEDACVPTINFRKIIGVKDIELTEKYRGDYALKLLVRTNEKEQWEVQSIIRLTVI